MPAPRSASAALDVRARAAQDVLYPCSDGRPMADNAWQSRAILKAAGDLEVAHPDVAPRRADGVTMIHSGVLGLDLRAEGEFIRMRDPATREDILHQVELKALAERETARREDAETHAEREAARRKDAETHAKREAEHAQQEATRRKHAEARAKREAERAEREAARAQREAADRLAAQARVAELEAALQLAEGRALRRSRSGSSNDQP